MASLQRNRVFELRKRAMIRTRWVRFGVVATVLLAAGVVFVFTTRARGEAWERWPDAESAGFSAAGLQDALDYTAALGTTGMLVVVGGKVLLEFGDLEARGYMADGRYSVLALLYGKPVADGTIDLDLTLDQIGIDDRGGLLPIEKRATIEQLLTNRSGVYHATGFGAWPEDAPSRGSVEPGSFFFDHPWGGLAACAVFELLTGRDFFRAVHEDLGAPLGFQDYRWRRHAKDRDPSPSAYPIFNLYMSTRDVARIGELVLRHGTWRGRQLVPAEWIDRVTSPVTPRAELNPVAYRELPLSAGFHWWPWEAPDPEGPFAGAFTTIGAFGQYLTVLPALDMVVAHQVFAGWYGPPKNSVTWTQYEGILDRLAAARLDAGAGEDEARSTEARGHSR